MLDRYLGTQILDLESRTRVKGWAKSALETEATCAEDDEQAYANADAC
jgi:hypothetical protein